MIGPTLPGLAENTNTQLGQISILFSARSVGFLIGALAGGRIYDRLPGHPVLTLPAWDCLPYDRVSPNGVTIAARITPSFDWFDDIDPFASTTPPTP